MVLVVLRQRSLDYAAKGCMKYDGESIKDHGVVRGSNTHVLRHGCCAALLWRVLPSPPMPEH